MKAGLGGRGPEAPSVRAGRFTFGEVTNLPEASDGTLLIVSRVVADASPARHDLVVPDQLVRNDAGQVVGAKSLSFVH